MPQIIKKLSPKKKTSKKTTKLALKKSLTKVAKKSHSPIDYYSCLMNYSQQGFYDEKEGKKLKIHACCKKCKLSAPSLNNQRDKELVKLISSYKQVGDSLAKLLKPLS